MSRLDVLARAQWPEPGDGAPPPLPGFVVSSFSPLVAAAGDRCLRRLHGQPPAASDRGPRTGIVVASRGGDHATLRAAKEAIAARRSVAPLLFFQSVPTSVAGHVAIQWGLGGPVVCTSPAEEWGRDDALATAALLIDDGDADEVLVVVAEQGHGGDDDRAEALLVARTGAAPRPGGG